MNRMTGRCHRVVVSPLRPGARVELTLEYAAPGAAASALICPPSPFLGGDRDNNVTRALSRALALAGFLSVRFDYGNPSEDAESRYEAWRRVEDRRDLRSPSRDVRSALDAAARYAPVRGLVGYSFGCAVLAELRKRNALPPRVPLALVAPPLARFDFDAIGREERVLIVVAGRDELDPVPETAELQRRFPVARIERIEEADHFLRGHEDAAADAVVSFLGEASP